MSLEVVLVGCALVIVINVIVVDDIVVNDIVIIAVIAFVNDDHVCGFGSGCALIGAF